MNLKDEFKSYSFDSTKNSICGEVFISSDQLFYISCRFCVNTFKNYEKFTYHFYENHIDNKCEDRTDIPKEFISIDISSLDTTLKYEENCLNVNDFIDDTIQTGSSKDTNSNILVSNTSFGDNCNTDSIDFNKNTQKQFKSLRDESFCEKIDNVNKKFQCDLCPTKFWTFEQLSLHQVIHNFKQTPSNLKALNKYKTKIGIFQQSHKNPNRFKCDECLSSFWSTEQLELHKTSHNLIDNSKIKDRNISLDELMIGQPIEEFYNKILEKNKANTQQCDTCGMCFPTVTCLKRHIMKHTGERPYKCEHCSRGFIRRQALILHLGAHSGEKQFKCEQCDKAYYRKDALQHHMKVHSDNVYSCSYCDKKFKIKSEKIYHERRHNNINRKRAFRPFNRKEKKSTITSSTTTQIKQEKKELILGNLDKNT